MKETVASCWLVLAALLVCSSRAYPPTVVPEPPFTTDDGGEEFNTVFWSPTGAAQYRVRCLVGNPEEGVVFREPQFTRGDSNLIYVSRPDLVEWTTVSGTQHTFAYPEPDFPFRHLLHGRLIRYQVNSVPDTLAQFGEATSVQDNQGPWISTGSFTCTDLNAGSSGDATGSVQIFDFPAGMMRAYVIWYYGDSQADQAPMPATGNDYYSFSVPPPLGGWNSMAGDTLKIRVHGVDSAAEIDGTESSQWMNESWIDFYEVVEEAGQPQVPPFTDIQFSGDEFAHDGQPGRPTTFRLQWSLDPEFASIQGQQDKTMAGDYGSVWAGELVNEARYWFRVGIQDEFGQFHYGEATASVADSALPVLESWAAQDLNEASIGPWTGSIRVTDIQLEYGFSPSEYSYGPFVGGIVEYRVGQNPMQTAILMASGNPPGNPATFSFSVPEPLGGWVAYAGQSINSMVVKVWDSAVAPDEFGPYFADNVSYFYPPDQTIDIVVPVIGVLSPQPNTVCTDSIWVVWNATDDQVPGGSDPDADETEDLTILLSYKRTPSTANWTQIAQMQNTATQPDSFLWSITGLMEGTQYALRAIARDPSSFADTALVQPFTINRPDTPSVTVIQPNGGEVILGLYMVKWRATDPDSLYGEPNLSLRIDGWYSPNAGASWQPMVWDSNLNDGQEQWDTSNLDDGEEYLVKLRVTDPRGLWAEDTSNAVFTIDNNDPPDEVVLIAPNGGETWYGTQTVRWFASDPDQQDTLRIKLNYRRYDPANPQFWNLIAPDAGDLSNTGQYQWSIPTYLQGQYEMQVVATDRGGLTASDTSDAPFVINSPDPPVVQVLAPNGGESWTGIQTIRWTATDPDLQFGDTLAVAIEVSPDSGSTWIAEAQGLANTGAYQWNTDQSVYPDGALYLIRVCATDTFVGTTVCDVSDGPFYVLNDDSPPSVGVLYPNGGESVRNEVLVRWLATDPDTTIGDTLAVGISFSADSGASWTDLAGGLANTGSWLWDIRTLDDGNMYLVRISATDRHDVTVYDTSDSTFSAHQNDPPEITLIQPREGDIWKGEQTIQWFATDPDLIWGDTLAVSLYVRGSSAQSWTPVALGLANTGSRLWDTGSVPDGLTYQIRAVARDSSWLEAADISGVFAVENVNEPPAPFDLVSPVEGATVTVFKPMLLWRRALDIDAGDRVSYEVVYWPDGGTQTRVSAGLDTTLTDLGWPQPLMDDTKYHWYVEAADSLGPAATRSRQTWWFATNVDGNDPPSEFDLLFPEDASEVHSDSALAFCWTASYDEDVLDSLWYEVYLDTVMPFTEHVASVACTTWRCEAPLVPGNQCHWAVRAVDSYGGERWSNETWEILILVPAITVNTPSSAWATGYTYEATWHSSHVEGLVDLELRNEEQSWVMISDTENDGAEELTVPADDSMVGTGWRIRVVSQQSPEVIGESDPFEIISGCIADTVTLAHTVDFPADPTSSTHYRLFGVPGREQLRVSSILEGTQGLDWRVYGDNGESENYLLELTAESFMAPGNGYWLIKREPLSITQNIRTVELDPYGRFSLALREGWSIISNPLDRAVLWALVENREVVSSLHAYRGDGYALMDTVPGFTLEPFEGYYIFSDVAETLALPYPFAPTTAPPSPAPDPSLWTLRVVLISAINTDRENFIGEARSAIDGRDRYDTRKPPIFLDQAFLCFPRPEWDSRYPRFSADIRAGNVDGHVWEVEIRNPARGTARIRVEGVEGLPSDREISLINLHNSVPVDLRLRHEYDFTTVQDLMRFRIIVGTPQFLAGAHDAVLPDAFELEQNHPNPFQQTTAIGYSLANKAHIRVEIVDLLGRRVRTLDQGLQERARYTVTWDGTDEKGLRVSSGVYVCRLCVDDDRVHTRPVVFIAPSSRH